MKPFTLALLLLMIPAIAPETAHSKKAILNLRMANGAFFRLADYTGRKPVVVSFFLHVCPPCEREIPHLQAIQDSRPDMAIVLIAGKLSSPEEADAFIERIAKKSGMTIRLPVAYDRFGDAEADFGVKEYPTTIVFDRSGEVAARVAGYSEEKRRALDEALAKVGG